jgi:hypothetical protein
LFNLLENFEIVILNFLYNSLEILHIFGWKINLNFVVM